MSGLPDKLKHFQYHTRPYRIWASMKTRCLNPKAYNYHNYGGRGITICESWKEFKNFYRDMGEPPTESHAIDRIDNSKGYSKENCRWVTQKENNRNRRDNHYYNGKTLGEWAEISGICRGTLKSRTSRHGWSIEKAISTPVSFDSRFKKKVA